VVEGQPEGIPDGSSGSGGGGSPAGDDRDRALGEARERARLLAEDAQRERELRLQAEARANATPPKPRPTRAQLQDLVDNGTLPQAAMDAELDQQARAIIVETTQATLAQQQAVGRVQSEIQAFQEKIPGLSTRGSDEWNRASREYQRLVALGHPEGLLTEATALRTAFGDPTQIVRDRSNERRSSAEMGGGGGAGSGDSGGNGAEAPPAGMPQERIAHYRKMIDKGVYKSMSDPMIARELKYMTPRENRRSA